MTFAFTFWGLGFGVWGLGFGVWEKNLLINFYIQYSLGRGQGNRIPLEAACLTPNT